uniref:Putative peptidyl-prolyl cis-trans isomerase n=1 Tax=Siphoviridae sp. ctkJH11 TaxID=2825641 RepID=A0A8S5PQ30_9CAUD|nr:MAG TPA: putative peptidyl-prolyl cis-trans isomerase [Siphoviridae sp. ctkJH11]
MWRNVIVLQGKERIHMKKQILCTILLTLFSFTFLGCSFDKSSEGYVEEDGTEVRTEDHGNTYTFEKFPRKIEYNETSFAFDSVEFYEYPVEYSKNLLVALYFDMNSMSEEELYWFKNEENEAFGVTDRPLHTFVSVYSEQNDFDSEDLSLLKRVFFADNYIVYVYELTNYRYSLAGESISISAHVKQGGTYEYENEDGEINDLDKNDTYYYFGELPEELEDLSDFADKRPNVYNAVFY